MKVKASSTPKVARPRAQKKTKAEAPAETSKAWKAEGGAGASKKKLSTIATNAAVSVIATHEGSPKEAAKHPLLARFGEHLGMGLGVIVTEALALLPKWNSELV